MLELTIALAIIGLLLGATLTGINALTSADLRKTTGMMQGLMADTYARTALSGDSHRIVFDLEASTYWVEKSQGGVVMQHKLLEPNKEGAADINPLDERIADLDETDDDAESQEKRRLYGPPSWEVVPAPGADDTESTRPQKIPGNITIKAIWVDHLAEFVSRGQVAVHYFPGGYVQEAFIILSPADDLEDSLSLILNPLTGEVYVELEEPEVPRSSR